MIRFVAFGVLYSAGLFLVPLDVTFDLSRSIVSFFPSIYGAFALISALCAGYIQDFLANRDLPISMVFTFGGFLIGIGMVLSSYAQSIAAVLCYAAITGTGLGFTGFSSAGLCSQWFKKRKGTTLLLAMSGNGFGSFFYAFALQTLLNYFNETGEDCTLDSASFIACDSWRQASRVGGCFSFLMIMIASPFMRLPRLGEVEEHESKGVYLGDTKADNRGSLATARTAILNDPTELNHPVTTSEVNADLSYDEQDEGLIELYVEDDDGDDDDKEGADASDRKVSQGRRDSGVSVLSSESKQGKRSSGASVLSSGSNRSRRPSLISAKQTMMTKTFGILVFWEVASSLTYNNFFVHVQAFALDVGLSSNDGAAALSLSGLAMVISGLTLGYISDRIGHIRALQSATICLMLTVLAWPHCTTRTALFATSFSYGYFAFALPSMPLAILTNTYGEVSQTYMLTLIGIIHAAQGPGKFLGPAITGFCYDYYGNYYSGAMFTFVVMLVGNITLLFLPSTAWQLKSISEKYSAQFVFSQH